MSARRRAIAAAAERASVEPDKTVDRTDYEALDRDHTVHMALLDMTIGTADVELNRIRAEHAACASADCPHLEAFDRHEARMLAKGQPWRMSPEPRHKRPR
ncbi:hypothetical protein RCO28_30495 [Streptomyces sp. LHD-70]|uniref:hypothetical protein n=1 Tax=Streptomyces sp. LHD-70 TaxID=3072140 RepID=UPI00280FACE9|nr:hypothetical protein [Streptomyces sp. LHD-70]MDQ8706770.1 hypothetical protein [Streptomyces sp. LHD-70]